MKRPTYRIEEKRHRILMSRLALDGLSYQDFADWCVDQYLADNINPKGEKEMKIIEIIELNEKGVKVDDYNLGTPGEVRYFDDNGGLPDGNFDEDDIQGIWIHLEGKHEIGEYAYREIDDSTLLKADNLNFNFDKDFAEKLDVYEDYSRIVVDIEKYDDEVEISAGFVKDDGRITEILLSKGDLEELLSQKERQNG